MNDYLVETPDGVGMALVASSDEKACALAMRDLKKLGLWKPGLSMFRYPMCWVDTPSKAWSGRTAGLVWVPLFSFWK